jgi:UMF1 family MFS transporter
VNKKPVRAWMLYDWANSAFATTVLAGFFPIFFKSYWAPTLPGPRSTALLGTAASIGVVLVLIVAIGLGALADRTSSRKKLLALFCFTGALSTSCLALVPYNATTFALALYILGTLGFAGGSVFYDALLPIVAEPEKLDDVSARGFALGYAGGGLLFAAQVALVSFPHVFGLADKAAAVKVAFVSTGIWWAAFAIPILLIVKEEKPEPVTSALAIIRESFSRLASTIRSISSYRDLFLFLLAFFCYMDGVGTIVKMAVAYGKDVGLEDIHLIGALLMVQFIGLPCAYLYGILARRLGRRRVILAGIVAYISVVVFAYFMSQAWHFFVLAAVVGMFQGGIQAISRSLYASMTPRGRSAEFFGFFTISNRFSTFLGPLVVGWTGGLVGNPRAGILTLLVLFAAGGALLLVVKPDRGRKSAIEAGG